MNRALWLLLALAWPREYQAPAHPTLRVMTYNIHHGEGMDGEFDLPRLALLMKNAEPDIIALQEVDVSTHRSSGVNQLAELARLTGMHAEFGKAMNFDGGDYGVAVLSRWPLSQAVSHPLPDPPDREPRIAFTVQVKAGDEGPVVAFTVTHLDPGGDETNRLRQATALNDLVTQGNLPAILAGDMNARADTDVMSILDSRWTNASLANLDAGERQRLRGDFVLYRPADCWRLVESQVIDDRIASDHRPVLVVLEWTARC